MSINKLVHKSKRIRQKKKGSTLLEIVISIAIMAILIIPVGNLILSSVKMNRLSEDKQQGQAILQQAVEKLKDSDTFKAGQYVQLQDGMKIQLIKSGDGFTISHTDGKDKYQITGTIKKNNEIQSTDIYSTVVDGVILYGGTKTYLSTNPTTIADAINNRTTENNINAWVDAIELNGKIINITRGAKFDTIEAKNKAILLITKAGSNLFGLSIKNTTQEVLSVYLYIEGKQPGDNQADGGDLQLNSIEGNVKLITGISEIDLGKENTVYEVELKISKGNREIETIKTNIIK